MQRIARVSHCTSHWSQNLLNKTTKPRERGSCVMQPSRIDRRSKAHVSVLSSSASLPLIEHEQIERQGGSKGPKVDVYIRESTSWEIRNVKLNWSSRTQAPLSGHTRTNITRDLFVNSKIRKKLCCGIVSVNFKLIIKILLLIIYYLNSSMFSLFTTLVLVYIGRSACSTLQRQAGALGA